MRHMTDSVNYLITYWQPISGLFLGALLVGIFLYIHTRKKASFIRWIAKNVFRSQFMAEKSAEGLFNVATSFVLTVGGLLIILAILYLTY